MRTDLEKTGAKNDEASSQNISEIMDMRSISIKNHEWMFVKMVQVSITKHDDIFEISVF